MAVSTQAIIYAVQRLRTKSAASYSCHDRALGDGRFIIAGTSRDDARQIGGASGKSNSESIIQQPHTVSSANLTNQQGDWKSQKEFKDKVWPLATFQAILLNIIFAAIREATSNLQERCSSLLRALTTTCIAGGLFSHERMRAQIHPSDSMLFAWTYIEETQRLALALFKVNTLFRTGMLRVEDLEFPLPENGYLWDAPETRDFYGRYHAQLESGAYARDPPLICDIFRDVKNRERGLGELLEVDSWLGFLASS
jgi:hypothetical protein